jgi:hypothetical protein
MKSKILFFFLLYGIFVGFLSFWWWNISDNLFLLNIPGMLLGDKVYDLSINLIGDPFSPQAHFTIPWVFRTPQVYVPVSVLFWGIFGIIIERLRNYL